MKLQILNQESTLFSGEITSVTFPGKAGSFQVLKNHAPLISSLAKGNITYVVAGITNNMAINGGLVEVKDNMIRVYID